MGAGNIYQAGEALIQLIREKGLADDYKNNRIGIILGGPSREAEVSRRTGTAVDEALRSLGYQTTVIEYDPPHIVEQVRGQNRCGISGSSWEIRGRRYDSGRFGTFGHPLYRLGRHGKRCHHG